MREVVHTVANDNFTKSIANCSYPDFMNEDFETNDMGNCFIVSDAFYGVTQSGHMVLYWQTIHCKTTK